MLYDHVRVDPIARYVVREEVPREECRGGGGLSRVRGGVDGEGSAFHRQCHVF